MIVYQELQKNKFIFVYFETQTFLWSIKGEEGRVVGGGGTVQYCQEGDAKILNNFCLIFTDVNIIHCSF